jgi:apolipoprotein N-acyltransferase
MDQYFNMEIMANQASFFPNHSWIVTYTHLGYGIIRLNHQKQEPIFRVTMIQPNISQTAKWSYGYFHEVVEKTFAMLNQIEPESVDLVVLPETSIPNFAHLVPSVLEHFQNESKRLNADIFYGILSLEKVDSTIGKSESYFNTGRWVKPGRMQDSVFNKVFLVPFSERLPFDQIFPILNFVDFGEGDFSPGTHVPLYETSNVIWTPNICYETIYPFFIRDQIKAGSQIIVNITNDGWFGKSTEPYQHLNLVRFRAVENAIPIVRNTNSGVSAFIDAYGRIFEQTKLHQEDIRTFTMPLRTEVTPYVRLGDFIEWFLLIFTFLLFLWMVRQKLFKCCL